MAALAQMLLLYRCIRSGRRCMLLFDPLSGRHGGLTPGYEFAEDTLL